MHMCIYRVLYGGGVVSLYHLIPFLEKAGLLICLKEVHFGIISFVIVLL